MIYDQNPFADGMGDYIREERMLNLFNPLGSENDDSGNILDKTGADAIFVSSFCNDYIDYEICRIARIYLENKGTELFNVSEFIPYSNETMQTVQPTELFRIKMISYMLYNARQKDEFSIALLKYLYKSYYRKEYKIIKRFGKINRTELWSIVSKEEFDYVSLMDNYESIARILTISEILGIQPDSSCNLYYTMLNVINSGREHLNVYESICDWDEEDVQKSEATISELFETDDIVEMTARSEKYEEMLIFMGKALEYYGYSSDYIDLSNYEFCGVDRDYSITLLLLNKLFPKRSFTKEEVECFAAILFATSAFCCAHNEFEDIMRSLTCEKPEYDEDIEFFDDEEFLKSVPAQKNNTHQKKESTPATKTIQKPSDSNISEEDLLKQISELQESLRNKDNQYKALSIQYSETKRKLSEAEIQNNKFRSEHDELIALRNHIYETTMSDTAAPQEITQDEMVQTLSSKKVLIVGGHTNWTSHMKELFPNWKYINFKSTTTIDDSVLNSSIDHVYFFTDMLKHHVYYRFVGLVKTKGIPFGYLNGSNIESTIKTIYSDLNK